MREVINTKKAPQAIGPYVQAIKSEGLLFVSGQLGIDIESGNLKEGVKDQTIYALNNLNEILKESKTDKTKVLKTTIFLANMEDFSLVNEIYAEFFAGVNPARSCVAVKTLPKNALVEIECIASV